jgi:hypothetical protein
MGAHLADIYYQIKAMAKKLKIGCILTKLFHLACKKRLYTFLQADLNS